MLKDETRRGISEVLYILNNTKKSDVEKIPDNFITFLRENASEEYIPDFELKQNINEMKLYPDTKNILAAIYRDYWCDDEARKRFDMILSENKKKKAEREKERINKIFSGGNEENIKENVNENIKESKELTINEKSSFIRFLEKIKEKFSKLFKHK